MIIATSIMNMVPMIVDHRGFPKNVRISLCLCLFPVMRLPVEFVV